MYLTALSKFSTIKKLSIILVLIVILNNIYLSTFVSASENQIKTVKIGLYDAKIFSSNNKVGYDTYFHEYFQKISNYADWKYEFVTGSLGDIVSKLDRGELDIIVPVQLTSSLSERLDFIEMPYYKSHVTLNVPDSSSITYNDFAAFNGLRVGMLKDGNINNDFALYQQRNNFSVIPFQYNKSTELSLALKDNKIDAVMGLNLRPTDGEKIVAKLFPVNHYFAVSKNNSKVFTSLTTAINKLRIDDPYFESRLHKKHYPYISSTKIAFSKEELEFINHGKKIRAVYDPDWYPVEYKDEETNTLAGITQQVFSHISNYSNLEFDIMNTANFKQSTEMVKDGYADILCGVLTYEMQSAQIKVTEPFFDLPFVIIGRKNTVINDNTVIAVPKKYTSIENVLKQQFPNQSISFFDTFDDCIYAVKNNNNFILMENTFVANQILLSLDAYGLEYISETSYSMHIGVSYKTNPILISILNKAILQITDHDKNKIATNINAAVSYQLPFSSVLTMYNKLIIALVSVLSLILLLITFFINRRNYLKLKVNAYTDSLTGGGNLVKFKLDAQQLLKKYGTDEYSVVYIDIDKFKYINDMFGYQQGDKTLKYVYDVLYTNLNRNELCARVSADWFALLMKNTSRTPIVERIQLIFNQISQFEVPGVEHYELILKCGIYIIEREEKDINKMLNKAMITRETVKGGHKSLYAFYTDNIMDQIIKEKELENDMMTALSNNEFIIYLQPKYDLKTRQISGAEALVRWLHPQKGLVPPMEFIPFFEKNGFIVSLDAYVFETVCKQLRWWIDNGYEPLPISVNISRVNLHQSDFVENYISIMNAYNISPELLELELTESAIFENQNLLYSIASDFRKTGISISIDDFGTGYSCLSLLGVIPFDTIKIDRKFLTDNFKTKGGKTVITKIIELAMSLEMTIVSEGVETSEQEEFLREIGCDMAQGYLFAHPMPIDNFNNLIAS